jgi:hypothetical protein
LTYNFDKVQDADFCCKYCFLNNVMSEFEQLEPDDFPSIVVVANSDLAHDLFRELSEVRCDCGERIFHFGYVEFNNYEYGDEYIISITTDNSLSIEPMVTETGAYLGSEGKIIFIHEDCADEAIERMVEFGNNVVVFGFEDDYED